MMSKKKAPVKKKAPIKRKELLFISDRDEGYDPKKDSTMKHAEDLYGSWNDIMQFIDTACKAVHNIREVVQEYKDGKDNVQDSYNAVLSEVNQIVFEMQWIHTVSDYGQKATRPTEIEFPDHGPNGFAVPTKKARKKS